MVDDERQPEEAPGALGKQADEGDGAEAKKERLKDLDVTDADAGSIKGGVPRLPDPT